MKKLCFGNTFRSYKLIQFFFVSNIIICLTHMGTYAKKMLALKYFMVAINCLIRQSVKNLTMLKNKALCIFQVLEFCLPQCKALNRNLKKVLSDFKWNLQQYYLFCEMPVKTKIKKKQKHLWTCSFCITRRYGQARKKRAYHAVLAHFRPFLVSSSKPR